MLIKQLIEGLSKLDQELMVYVINHYDGESYTEELEEIEHVINSRWNSVMAPGIVLR